jgi:hypothetical protein
MRKVIRINSLSIEYIVVTPGEIYKRVQHVLCQNTGRITIH